MTPVWIRFSAELRSRRMGWLGLALVAGLAGGIILATAAGARRTDSALDRFFATTHLGDAYVYRGWAFQDDTLEFGRIARLRQVAEAQRSALLAVISRSRSGRPIYPAGPDTLAYFVRTDGRGTRSIDSPKLLHGRLPEPARASEAIVDAPGLRILGIHVGDKLRVRVLTRRAVRHGTPNFGLSPADPRNVKWGSLATVRIVGEFAGLHPGVENAGRVYLTPAFYLAHGGPAVGVWLEVKAVRLKRGQADVPAFRAAVERIAGIRNYGFSDPREEWTGSAQRSIALLAQALQLLAGIGGAVALLLVGQALFRQAVLESAEDPILRGLGMTRGQLVAVGGLRAAVQAAPAAGLAVALAFLLSPLAPVGRARQLEPHPGFAVDPLVFAAGAAIVFGSVLLAGVLAAWLVARLGDFGPVARHPTQAARGGDIAVALSRAGCPPSVVAGVRMALSRDAGASAARVTLAASVLAVGVTAAGVTFAGSLHHLFDTPRLYGQNWDYDTGDEGGPGYTRAQMRRLLDDPMFSAVAIGATATVKIKGREVGVRATDNLKGSVPPTVIEGRAPRAPDEVLLGAKTLHALGVRIGDAVRVRSGRRAVSLRVVGTGMVAAPPELNSFTLGEGAAFSFGTLKRIAPEATRTDVEVRVAPHVDRATALARLDALFGVSNAAERPLAVGDFGGVDDTPYLISGLVAGAAAAALAHLLITSIRRRRRDVAILRTLGFTPGQLRATVAWQATTIAVAGLAVGLPMGVFVGRFAWNVFADNLGVVPEPVTPIGITLLAIPATILVALVVATVPGRMAAGTRPAVVLRAE